VDPGHAVSELIVAEPENFMAAFFEQTAVKKTAVERTADDTRYRNHPPSQSEELEFVNGIIKLLHGDDRALMERQSVLTGLRR
jgi:hypothetical protein